MWHVQDKNLEAICPLCVSRTLLRLTYINYIQSSRIQEIDLVRHGFRILLSSSREIVPKWEGFSRIILDSTRYLTINKFWCFLSCFLIYPPCLLSQYFGETSLENYCSTSSITLWANYGLLVLMHDVVNNLNKTIKTYSHINITDKKGHVMLTSTNKTNRSSFLYGKLGITK